MPRRSIAQIKADDAALSAAVVELLADTSASATCPLHGANCPAWATLGAIR